MTDQNGDAKASSEYTWDGVRDAQLRATADATPAERLETVEEMIELAYQTGALPVYRVTFRVPVEVRVDPGHLEEVLGDPIEVDALRTFHVLSVSLHDGTREAARRAWDTHRRLARSWGVVLDEMQTRTLREEHPPMGDVHISDARGEERCLDLGAYLGIVGLDGEFADRQPVDWQGYQQQLDALYRHILGDEQR